MVKTLMTENAQLLQEKRTLNPASDSVAPPAPSDSDPPHGQPSASSGGPSNRSSPTVERVLYIPKDKKCSTFTGRGEVTIREWVDEIRSTLRTRRMSTLEQAHFIYDHLGGDARDEIKYRSRQVQEDPDSIFSILQAQYGCADSPIALMQNFHSRKQQESESLREYANALFSLMDTVVRHSPEGVPRSAVLLRDQFIEYVSDGNLSRALKEIVRRNPNYDLHDIRDAAIRWEREGRPWEGRARSYSVPSVYSMPQQANRRPDPPSTHSSLSAEVAELKEMFMKQQEQFREFSQTLLALNPPRHPPFQPRGPLICRRCQQPGHFARECENEQRVYAPRPNPPREGATHPAQQPSGN